MKKNIAAILSTITACVLLSACSKTVNTASVAPEITFSESSVAESTPTASLPQENSLQENEANEELYAEYAYILENTQRVGEEGKGFVDVPEDWVKFTDISPNTDFQYSDKYGVSIITMNKVDFSNIPQEQIDELTLDTITQTFMYSRESQYSGDIESNDAYIIDVNGLKSHQIVTTFKDGTFLIQWIVEVDGEFYSILAEGLNASAGELITLVEKTYNPLQ